MQPVRFPDDVWSHIIGYAKVPDSQRFSNTARCMKPLLDGGLIFKMKYNTSCENAGWWVRDIPEHDGFLVLIPAPSARFRVFLRKHGLSRLFSLSAPRDGVNVIVPDGTDIPHRVDSLGALGPHHFYKPWVRPYHGFVSGARKLERSLSDSD